MKIKKTLLFLFLLASIVKAQDRPNIVFILTDDQSYDLLGFTGNPIIQTKNLFKTICASLLNI